MLEHTPKHFVLQLGSLISLYLSISFLLVLLFGLINIRFPDPIEGFYALESAASAVRTGVAAIIVFAPTYFILTRIVNKMRRKTSGGYLPLTRWLIYLSLLVGGGALLVDLVVVIYTFLEGDITNRFILKAFSVLVVVGIAFHYYLLDARGHWLKNEQKSIMFGVVAGLAMFAALAYGLANIETPSEVREGLLDEKQITDLQYIQSNIEIYYYENQKLPPKLEDITNVPAAPENRDSYTYQITDLGFQLCAAFATSNELKVKDEFATPIDKNALIKNAYNWQHGVGETCFKRVINKPDAE
jgi:hypothetical protein